MHKNRTILGVLALLLLMIATEACRSPRCPIESCHIRMRHRHPSFMKGGGGGNGGEGVTIVDINASPEANLGKVYRGVPWWERNKDPKIAYKYNPKYKYKHKDSKPWSARILKYKSKRAKKVADDERKAAKQAAKDGEGEATEEGETPEGEDNLMPPQPEGVDTDANPAEGSEMTNTDSKKAKKEKKKKEKKPKEPKKPKEKKSKQDAPPAEEETEEEGF